MCEECGLSGAHDLTCIHHPDNEHVNYPHEPGRLYDCPACEAMCHCVEGETECVFDGEHRPMQTLVRLVPM